MLKVARTPEDCLVYSGCLAADLSSAAHLQEHYSIALYYKVTCKKSCYALQYGSVPT